MNRDNLAGYIALAIFAGPWVFPMLGLYVFPREMLWLFLVLGFGPMVLLFVVPLARIAAAADRDEFALFCLGFAVLGFLYAVHPVGAPIFAGAAIAMRYAGKGINHFWPD